ncbi:MAG: hypothetical protein WCU80_04415 [Paludibacteraceae bacterium]
MGKSELLDVILRDIKELELITQGMREMDKVPSVMRDLARTKALNIYDGFCHINEVSSQVFSDQLQKTRGIEVSAVPEVEQVAASLAVSTPSEQKETQFQAQTSAAVECVVEPERMVLPEPNKIEIEVPEMEVVSAACEAEPPLAQEKPECQEEGKRKLDAKKELEEMRNMDSDAYPFSEKNEESDKKGTVIANVSDRTHKSITNERFRTNVKSLNETVSVGRKPEGRFVNSLRKAINLNDRFRYRKDLFGGDADLMNRTIDTLEGMDSFDRAMEYLLSQFSWDLNSQAAGDFVALLEARFS